MQTPEPDLGAGIKEIHEAFAKYVNVTRGEHGHVFGARFKNKLVQTERYYAALVRYIARNPVAAGLVEQAEQWPWSAHAALCGLAPVPGFLDAETSLAFFGSDRLGYRQFVAQANEELLRTLLVTNPTVEGVAIAHDEHRIPVVEIADFLGISKRSAYRKLADARAVTQGPGPLVPVR